MLRAQNISIRGHSVVSGVEECLPEWIINKDVGQVESNVDRRINYVVDHYKGIMAHWDVDNEQMHGDWFEQKTWNRNFLPQTFEKVHQLDPDALLFLNDYQIVNFGYLTQAYINSARTLLASNTPLHGIGIQSHIKSAPDMTTIAYRLDRVAEVGLPIWITELDVEVSNIFV